MNSKIKTFVIILLLAPIISNANEHPQALQRLLLTPTNDTFKQVVPPPYTEISVRYDAPPMDWFAREDSRIYEMTEPKVSAELRRAKARFKTQPNKTKDSAWDISPLLSSLISMYLVSGAQSHLEEVVEVIEYLFHVRMDSQSRRNFRGQILPQWERLDRYNIFHVSNYATYDAENLEELKSQRGWHTLYFSDINYTGLILDQLLRFAQVVWANEVEELYDSAARVLLEAQKTFESHDAEWVQATPDSGYYIFPNNSPFFLDGVELPVNEAAVFGSATVRLYLLTGEQKFLTRARHMYRRWQSSFGVDRFGFISYPYVIGDWFKGWDRATSPSVNSPGSPPVTGFENFQKAGLTIQFMLLLEAAGESGVERYLREFKKIIAATDAMSHRPVTSDYPYTFGFYFPTDSVHYRSVYYLGWVALMHDDRSYMSQLRLSWETGFVSNADFLQAALLDDKLSRDKTTLHNIILRPNTVGDFNAGCDLMLSHDAIAQVKFQHTTPKSNKLYLHLNESDERVRLRIDERMGYFRGKFFVPANRCINLSWDGTSLTSYPQGDDENLVELTLIRTVR